MIIAVPSVVMLSLRVSPDLLFGHLPRSYRHLLDAIKTPDLATAFYCGLNALFAPVETTPDCFFSTCGFSTGTLRHPFSCVMAWAGLSWLQQCRDGYPRLPVLYKNEANCEPADSGCQTKDNGRPFTKRFWRAACQPHASQAKNDLPERISSKVSCMLLTRIARG